MFYRKTEKKLAREQRKLSHCENHTREEMGLLEAHDVRWTSVLRRPERSGDPSPVGAGEISTGKAPRERRGGHVCKIVK